MGILADFEFLTKVARPGQWMQVSNHCSSNCFKKQTSTLGLQKLLYVDKIGIFGGF